MHRRQAIVALAAFPFAKSAFAGRSPGKKLRLAVIPKGTTHEFWKTIHAGALKAQAELKAQGREVELLWKGPLREDDRTEQIAIVETFRTQKVDGIALAPLDDKALVRPVEEAVKAGIPVVIFDSDLASKRHSSFIATDNAKGGSLGAKRLGELLRGKGNVILLRYNVGSASTDHRERGFLAGIAKFPGVKVVSSDKYAGATAESAMKTSQNLLNRFGKQVDGIFTPNESATVGMLRALKDAGLLGKVKFVGFDASKPLIDGLTAKHIHGLVLQDPFNMSYQAVRTLVQIIDRQPVKPVIDTGVHLATPENMNEPRIEALLHPPVA